MLAAPQSLRLNVQPFWAFPLRRILQRWFNDSTFTKLREDSLADRKGGFLDGEEAARLEAELGVSMADPRVLHLQAGLDWGSLYKTTNHSTGIVLLK